MNSNEFQLFSMPQQEFHSLFLLLGWKRKGYLLPQKLQTFYAEILDFGNIQIYWLLFPILPIYQLWKSLLTRSWSSWILHPTSPVRTNSQSVSWFPEQMFQWRFPVVSAFYSRFLPQREVSFSYYTHFILL